MSQPPQWQPLAPPPQPMQQPMPYYGGQGPITPSRPAMFYKVFGIVSAVLGGCGIIYAFISIASVLFFSSRGSMSRIYDGPMIAYSVGHAAGSMLTGAILIAAGIGMSRGKRWSRIAGITYATLSLLATVGGAMMQLLVIQPRMFSRMSMGMGRHSSAAGVEMISIVSTLFGVLVMMVLPTVMLIAVLRPQARQELVD